MTQIGCGARIVFEGGDACGKRTQSLALVEELTQRGTLAERFSFPQYDRPAGELIGRLLKSQATMGNHTDDALVLQSLMAYDRMSGYLATERVVGRGGHAVCDRWWPSSLYGLLAEGLNPQAFIDESSFMPADLYILLDLPVEVAMSRRPVAQDKYEARVELRQMMRDAYLEEWERRGVLETGLSRWHVIALDGSEPESVVSSRVVALVDDFLCARGSRDIGRLARVIPSGLW